MFGFLRKLRACKHFNTGAFNYVRDDGFIADLVSDDDYKSRQLTKDRISGLRYCLDCGATQRFSRIDPLALNPDTEKEPWLAPWLWRKQ